MLVENYLEIMDGQKTKAIDKINEELHVNYKITDFNHWLHERRRTPERVINFMRREIIVHNYKPAAAAKIIALLKL